MLPLLRKTTRLSVFYSISQRKYTPLFFNLSISIFFSFKYRITNYTSGRVFGEGRLTRHFSEKSQLPVAIIALAPGGTKPVLVPVPKIAVNAVRPRLVCLIYVITLPEPNSLGNRGQRPPVPLRVKRARAPRFIDSVDRTFYE